MYRLFKMGWACLTLVVFFVLSTIDIWTTENTDRLWNTWALWGFGGTLVLYVVGYLSDNFERSDWD